MKPESIFRNPISDDPKIEELKQEVITEFELFHESIMELLPTGRGRSLVVTKLQEACYWAKYSLLHESE